jgi:cell division protein FtsX
MGAGTELMADVEADFLPTSLEIVLATGPDLPRRAADVALRLRRLPGVASVDAVTAGLVRVAGIEALASRLAGLLGGAAILVAVALCAAVIGRERARLREEAETLALVGVQTTMARVPAGLVGMLAAVVGGFAGLQLGSWLATALFGSAVPPSAVASLAASGAAVPVGLPGRELLLALLALAMVGIAVGCLSVPARRMVNAAG